MFLRSARGDTNIHKQYLTFAFIVLLVVQPSSHGPGTFLNSQRNIEKDLGCYIKENIGFHFEHSLKFR
jgi:hypothetical protein